MAELADAHDSKSCEVTPRVGSTPTSGTIVLEVESNGALRRAKRGKDATKRSSGSKADGRLRPKDEAPTPTSGTITADYTD